MILATALGWTVTALTGLPNGVAFGLLLGVLAAPFVPTGSCRVTPRDDR